MSNAPAKPRAPESIRRRLREAVQRLQAGPQWTDIGPPPTVEDIKIQHASWLETWVTSELRPVLAYLDGQYTAHEIDVYGHGDRYARQDPEVTCAECKKQPATRRRGDVPVCESC